MWRKPSRIAAAKRRQFQVMGQRIAAFNAHRAAAIADRQGPSPTAQKRAERDRARKAAENGG